MTTDFITHLKALTTTSKMGADVSGSDLAEILKTLAEHEESPGGPYWYQSAAGVRSLDLGLNLLVANFLRTQDVVLPQLDSYLQNALAAGPKTSAVLDEATLAAHIATYHAAQHGGEAADSRSTVKTGIDYEADEMRVMDELWKATEARLGAFPSEFRDNILEVLKRTVAGNPDKQMSLMAHYLRQALGNEGERFDDSFVAELGLLNTFFWSAFIVYDDFWDEDEAAEPRLLPAANLMARHYVASFSTLLPEDTGFRQFFHQLMDELDAANTWEMMHCRLETDGPLRTVPAELPAYDDFTIKFYPAAGHVFGPVAMLVQCGCTTESREVKQFIEYCQHYLIAMQLNDDAHDWKEDLERGHISTAVYLLIQAWQKAHPTCRAIHMEKDLAALEQLFLFEVLEPISTLVLERCEKARQALGAMESLTDREPLEQFIVKNEDIAHQALREYKKANDFLAAV